MRLIGFMQAGFHPVFRKYYIADYSEQAQQYVYLWWYETREEINLKIKELGYPSLRPFKKLPTGKITKDLPGIFQYEMCATKQKHKPKQVIKITYIWTTGGVKSNTVMHET